jgi:hypothetical protein
LPNGDSITVFAWGKTPGRTGRFPTEIQNNPLPNTGLERYRCANLLDKIIIIVVRDNSVDAATGWVAGVRFQGGARDFSLLHSVQTECVAQPASYWMDFTG